MADIPENLNAFLAHACEDVDEAEPKTLREAMKDPRWPEWELAAVQEYDSLMQNKTWKLVDLPEGAIVLRGKWVYKVKRDANGRVIRFKARWVVRGFEQREGIDFDEVFASVVKPMSYKALFAIVAAEDMELEQMDVKTAFLYGNIDREIYVEQPHGFLDEKNSAKVCRLLKALYGLKQSPRIWYNTLSTFLTGLGYAPLNADTSIFQHKGTIVAIYVDDLLIAGRDKAAIQDLKNRLSKEFEMADLGPCQHYLGMKVTRDRANRKLFLSQEAYLEKVLKDFDMSDCKPKDVPMPTSMKLRPVEEGYVADAELKSIYQSAVGSLMYAMLGTRPDIAYAVSSVSRFSANPTPEHMTAVKHILRYLKATIDMQLTYSGDLSNLEGYTDADWAGCAATARSTSGYVFNIGSGAISWCSKRQGTVALSTCEAEYVAQALAARESVWLRTLLDELNPKSASGPESSNPQPVMIYGDNQSAIALAKNPQFHARTKHIHISHHYCREKMAAGEISLEYVPSELQVADALTKALPGPGFRVFREEMGLEGVQRGAKKARVR